MKIKIESVSHDDETQKFQKAMILSLNKLKKRKKLLSDLQVNKRKQLIDFTSGQKSTIRTKVF